MRKPMVTRSFETMICTTMCVNVNTAQVEVQDLTLSRTYKTEEEILKALKKEYETKSLKIVAINETKTETKLFGMSESDFLKYSVELDPETRKALEVEENEEDEEE